MKDGFFLICSISYQSYQNLPKLLKKLQKLLNFISILYNLFRARNVHDKLHIQQIPMECHELGEKIGSTCFENIMQHYQNCVAAFSVH